MTQECTTAYLTPPLPHWFELVQFRRQLGATAPSLAPPPLDYAPPCILVVGSLCLRKRVTLLKGTCLVVVNSLSSEIDYTFAVLSPMVMLVSIYHVNTR